tara:strand:+ start:388 stop:534 length:147 start_codon:yes stop_codon:yes gene_type:complete
MREDDSEYSTHRYLLICWLRPSTYLGKIKGELTRKWKKAESAKNPATI